MAEGANLAMSAGLQARAAELVALLDPPDDFNFRHFRLRHMIAELLRTIRPQGLAPGAMVPDLELVSTQGGRLRLRDLRGTPALLHLVSYT